MTGVGIILYGPPASGKDTVTEALTTLDHRCELYRRMKIGSGRTTGYRMGNEDKLRRLTAAGQVIYTNNRYGAVYVIDRPELDRLLNDNRSPVVHLGQVEAIDILTAAMPATRWVVVELWCPRSIAAARIEARGTGDTAARLRAYDETTRLADPDLRIDTSQTDPNTASRLIMEIAMSDWTIVVPALHLTDDDGGLDLAATREYAQAASSTWIDRFLLNGSTTRGDLLTVAQRESILDIWSEAAGVQRLLACTWEQADLDIAAAKEITPMAVMRGLQNADAALDFLRQLPTGATVYSHPIYGHPLDPDLVQRAIAAECLPAGGKLAKIKIHEVEQIHLAAPDFVLWDGSARHLRESVEAGAAGIVATPLAALLAAAMPNRDIDSVQESINTIQGILDQLPGRPERSAYLLDRVKAALRA